jgi:site-specific recombinase XerD
MKLSTRAGYRLIVHSHLLKSGLARMPLEAIDGEHLDAYIQAKRKAGLGNRTVNRHLNLLHRPFEVARKRKRVRANPVDDIERPKDPDVEQPVLKPVEIGASRGRLRNESSPPCRHAASRRFANAVYHATGVRIRELPIRPEMLLATTA